MTADRDDAWTAHLAELVCHATRLLRPQTHAAVDPEDVVSSAVHSFLAFRAGNAGAPNENLFALLLDYVERHCQKWNMRSRRHPSISLQPSNDDKDRGFEPTAAASLEEQTRCFDELIEHLAGGLMDREKEIFLLLIEGLSIAEISKRVDRVDRTVRRCRDAIVRKLHELMARSEA